MQLVQTIPETSVLSKEPNPLGTLTIIIYVEPAFILYIDSFPGIIADPLNLVSSKVDFGYIRHQYKYAWLRWNCVLSELWQNDKIYKLIRKHLYAHFDDWKLYINLSIPYKDIFPTLPFQ
ncbi:hypothetical protein ES705_23378 [subsurface metagenome]